MVNPIGPLSVKINSSVIINCTITDPESHIRWTVHYKNNTALSIYVVPGAMVIYSTSSSSLLLAVHVLGFTITGIQCSEFQSKPDQFSYRSGTLVHLKVQGMLIL